VYRRVGQKKHQEGNLSQKDARLEKEKQFWNDPPIIGGLLIAISRFSLSAAVASPIVARGESAVSQVLSWSPVA